MPVIGIGLIEMPGPKKFSFGPFYSEILDGGPPHFKRSRLLKLSLLFDPVQHVVPDNVDGSLNRDSRSPSDVPSEVLEQFVKCRGPHSIVFEKRSLAIWTDFLVNKPQGFNNQLPP